MDSILVLSGVTLIALGLLDVFFAVLHYDDLGYLSNRLHRGIWAVVRGVTVLMPRNLRNFGLSLGAPLMIPATIFLWAGLEILGFALIYYVGMGGEHFAFDNEVESNIGAAVYLSGVTLATLGYGDITPISPLYEAIALGEALIGFVILSLTISYVLGIYRVLHQLSVLGSDLYHQAEDAGDPRSVLISHFPDGRPRNLDPHLMSLYRGIIDFAEGVRRYPIVYYFYGRRPYRSMPYAFYTIGGLAAALRWGLPKGHPAAQEPWLPALIAGFTTVTAQLRKRFVPSRGMEEPPEAVDFVAFVDCLEKRANSSDDWLGRFLDLERWMRRLAKLDDTPLNTKEAYARYREWLPFAHRADAFVEAVLEDLGREPDEFSRDPGARLFEVP